MVKINTRLVPIKAHYFFFMAGKIDDESGQQLIHSLFKAQKIRAIIITFVSIPLFTFRSIAMGPILPQINVFGKDLGVSPDVMGLITSILPILYILAKPAVGYLIDSFPVSAHLKSGICPKSMLSTLHQMLFSECTENDLHVDCH